MADNKYADGEVPLGDGLYVTEGAKKGYVYLCNVRKVENAGAQAVGPWIDSVNKTWNINEKISVLGATTWDSAVFTNTAGSSARTLVGNGLPINHATGTFPVGQSDPAYQYDRNPNTISAHDIKLSVPSNPKYSNTPYCMGGEVGVMLSGVPMFNAFDEGLRDAVANEVQDSCEGHPQQAGHYHYHGPSSCWKEESVKKVIGYALDGFPITGARVAKNKYLTTEDLDECHGITSNCNDD
jgi:YHYH protein